MPSSKRQFSSSGTKKQKKRALRKESPLKGFGLSTALRRRGLWSSTISRWRRFLPFLMVHGADEHAAGVDAHHLAGRQVGDGDAGLAHQLLRLIVGVDAAEDDPVFAGAVVQHELEQLLALGDGGAFLDLDGPEVGLGEGVEVHEVLEQGLHFHLGEVDGLGLDRSRCGRGGSLGGSALGSSGASAALGASRGFMVGNSSTSRMEAESVSSMTRRSKPKPRPPVGGRPYSRALTIVVVHLGLAVGLQGLPLGHLALEALLLVDGVVQLAEGVAELGAVDEVLKPLVWNAGSLGLRLARGLISTG